MFCNRDGALERMTDREALAMRVAELSKELRLGWDTQPGSSSN
jgi:hypothetical protein